MTYRLIDSGKQKKFEQFGDLKIVRPCAQALWNPQSMDWEDADATFSRSDGSAWEGKLPKSWVIEHKGIKFKISPTDFGHLGIFPEHSFLWGWAANLLDSSCSVLNLFAYSGGATMAFAKTGASVCHVDASQGMVKWARENAKLNGLEDRPIRWIVDDAIKFIRREIKRGRRYDGILLDPPSFGRGAKGEVFKIEEDIQELLSLCSQLLSDKPRFLACSNHTNQMTPTVMGHLFEEALSGITETGELLIKSESGRDIPTGTYARWTP